MYIVSVWMILGYVNTCAYMLAPTKVPPNAKSTANGALAIAYQGSHMLGLFVALVLALALYGSFEVWNCIQFYVDSLIQRGCFCQKVWQWTVNNGLQDTMLSYTWDCTLGRWIEDLLLSCFFSQDILAQAIYIRLKDLSILQASTAFGFMTLQMKSINDGQVRYACCQDSQLRGHRL